MENIVKKNSFGGYLIKKNIYIYKGDGKLSFPSCQDFDFYNFGYIACLLFYDIQKAEPMFQ